MRGAALGLMLAGLMLPRTVGPEVPAEWFEPTEAEQVIGFAARYDPGLMALVLRNRGLELASYHRGAVAMLRRGDLGREVWIFVRGEWFGPYLVVDCSNRRNFSALRARGRVAELSDREWRALGLGGAPAIVIVSFADPWPAEVGPVPF